MPIRSTFGFISFTHMEFSNDTLLILLKNDFVNELNLTSFKFKNSYESNGREILIFLISER